MRPFWTAATAMIALIALGSSLAVAGERAEAPADHLPGVTDGYSIVKPLPEPDEEPAQSGAGNHFKVGDVDVRISGSIKFDVGIGSIHPSRH